MGIERHRGASREAEVSGSERVNTALSGSRRVDDSEGHLQGEIRGPTKLVKMRGRDEMDGRPEGENAGYGRVNGARESGAT